MSDHGITASQMKAIINYCVLMNDRCVLITIVSCAHDCVVINKRFLCFVELTYLKG